MRRLGLPTLSPAERAPDLSAGYATAGFALTAVRPLSPDQFARWPSTWVRRLAHGQARAFWLLEARASGSAVRT
jgi:hypothetical protein